MNNEPLVRRIWKLPLGLCFAMACGILIAGCGNGGGAIGTQVTRSPGQRPDIDSAMAATGSLIVPDSAVFNITGFNFGGEGDARAMQRGSSQSGNGAAVEVRDGGSAWAEFQLGYCFDNTSGIPLEAKVKVCLKTSESRTADRGEQERRDAPLAAATLKFFIKDTNGLLIKDENLVVTSLAKGPESSSTAHDLVFDARFEPERGYYIVLAGRVDAKVLPGKTASVMLEVAECVFDISWQKARPTEVAEPAGVSSAEPEDVPASP